MQESIHFWCGQRWKEHGIQLFPGPTCVQPVTKGSSATCDGLGPRSPSEELHETINIVEEDTSRSRDKGGRVHVPCIARDLVIGELLDWRSQSQVGLKLDWLKGPVHERRDIYLRPGTVFETQGLCLDFASWTWLWVGVQDGTKVNSIEKRSYAPILWRPRVLHRACRSVSSSTTPSPYSHR